MTPINKNLWNAVCRPPRPGEFFIYLPDVPHYRAVYCSLFTSIPKTSITEIANDDTAPHFV